MCLKLFGKERNAMKMVGEMAFLALFRTQLIAREKSPFISKAMLSMHCVSGLYMLSI